MSTKSFLILVCFFMMRLMCILFTFKNPKWSCLRFSDVLGILCKRSVAYLCQHFLHTEVMYFDAFFHNGFLAKLKGWQNSSSFLLLSHQVKICSMATVSMLANMLLGLQHGTPAQDTCARVYRDRMSHGKASDWCPASLQGAASEDVGDIVTPYRKAALHLWDHQLNVLDGISLYPSGRQPEGWVHAWWNCLVFFPPLLQSTTFDLFLVKRNLSFPSFLSWQVP